MIKFVDRLEFLLTEAITSLRRDAAMSFAAVTTTALALTILGGFALASVGLARFASHVQNRFELKVFLADGSNTTDQQSLLTQIQAIPGVEWAKFESKEEVWAQFKKEHPDIDADGLELDNPMPDAIVVKYPNLTVGDKVEEFATSQKSVDSIAYMAAEQRLLDRAASAIRWLGSVLGGTMLLASGLLIFNAVRLATQQRKAEAHIMRLVGATERTIRAPMLLEGWLQGSAGGVIATIALALGHVALIGAVKSMGVIRFDVSFPLVQMLFACVMIGGLYGLVCSWLALRIHLRPEAQSGTVPTAVAAE